MKVIIRYQLLIHVTLIVMWCVSDKCNQVHYLTLCMAKIQLMRFMVISI